MGGQGGGSAGEAYTFTPLLSLYLSLSHSLSPCLAEGVNVWEKRGLVPEPRQNGSACVSEALEVSHCHDVTATQDSRPLTPMDSWRPTAAPPQPPTAPRRARLPLGAH